MKKKYSDILFFTLGGALGMGVSLAGAIFIIASFLTPLPIFQGIMLLTAGVVLIIVSRIYSTVFSMMEKLEKTISNISGLNPKDMSVSPQDSSIFVHEIKIDEETTEEEIQDIKKKFPFFSKELDGVLKTFRPADSTALLNKLELLSLPQLEKELGKAVENDNFERAAEIKNEINSRKLK